MLFAISGMCVAAEPGAGAAKCVKIELLDQDSLPVRDQPAVAGLVVGGKPIIPEGDYPAHSAIRMGIPTSCPAALVETVAENYKESCLTAERRAQTARTNKVSNESVSAQCQAIRDGLGSSLAPFLK
jgi:hypothetical protein